jgi:predicted GIY-YIG superfamily endonuclease
MLTGTNRTRKQYCDRVFNKKQLPIETNQKVHDEPSKAATEIFGWKKTVFIQLPFKGDDITRRIQRRLKMSIENCFYAAKLALVNTTKPFLVQSKIEQSSVHVTSKCVYQFTCTCNSMYIGRTERRLAARVAEHIPKKLQLKGDGIFKSSIAKHLIDTGHNIDLNTSFKVLTRQSTATLLRFAEAVAIRRMKPNLCVQKEMVVNLCLPW